MYKQESDERYKLLEIPVSNRPPELCHTLKLHNTDTKIAHHTTYNNHFISRLHCCLWFRSSIPLKKAKFLLESRSGFQMPLYPTWHQVCISQFLPTCLRCENLLQSPVKRKHFHECLIWYRLIHDFLRSLMVVVVLLPVHTK